jgi:hypothetical protein
MKTTNVIIYEYTKGKKILHEAFAVPSDFPEKWARCLARFNLAETDNAADLFMETVEKGEWSGNEIMAFAVAGFMAPARLAYNSPM